MKYHQKYKKAKIVLTIRINCGIIYITSKEYTDLHYKFVAHMIYWIYQLLDILSDQLYRCILR